LHSIRTEPSTTGTISATASANFAQAAIPIRRAQQNQKQTAADRCQYAKKYAGIAAIGYEGF
jgi:hypothetical protein